MRIRELGVAASTNRGLPPTCISSTRTMLLYSVAGTRSALTKRCSEPKETWSIFFGASWWLAAKMKGCRHCDSTAWWRCTSR